MLILIACAVLPSLLAFNGIALRYLLKLCFCRGKRNLVRVILVSALCRRTIRTAIIIQSVKLVGNLGGVSASAFCSCLFGFLVANCGRNQGGVNGSGGVKLCEVIFCGCLSKPIGQRAVNAFEIGAHCLDGVLVIEVAVGIKEAVNLSDAVLHLLRVGLCLAEFRIGCGVESAEVINLGVKGRDILVEILERSVCAVILGNVFHSRCCQRGFALCFLFDGCGCLREERFCFRGKLLFGG